MKRTCHEITAAKNEHKTTKPPRKKHQKTDAVNCFAWLPIEMVEKILMDLPQPLDKVTRLVSRGWRETIQTRWKHRIKNPTRTCARDPPEDEESALCWRREGPVWVKPCVEWAIDNQAMGLMKWLICVMLKVFRYNPQTPREWLKRACAFGNTKVIAWLISTEAPEHIRRTLSSYDVSRAAKGGDLACYKFVFFQSDYRGNPRIEDVYKACRGGHLDTVQWIMSNCGIAKEFEMQNQPKFEECLLNACRGGHKQVVDWLIVHILDYTMFCGNRNLTVEYTKTAMLHDHLELVKHLLDHWKCPVDTSVLRTAVHKGNVQGFRFVWDALIDKDQEEFRIRPWVCVENRYFGMLDVLAERDCLAALDQGLFKRAVRDDEHDLAMLQWLWKRCDQDAIAVDLRANDTTCNVVFMKALYSGHLDMLDWMQGLGFGWELSAYSRVSILERLASRSQYKGDPPVWNRTPPVWNTTGKHARGPKASLVWLHQQALVDLSEARLLPNGKIWFHFDCDRHQEKTNPGSWTCRELMGYENTSHESVDDTPWSYSTETATGEYLIARKSK